MKVLHLTHTDPRSDNRIIKELSALAETKNYKLTCIGLEADEGAASSKHDFDAKIVAVRLLTNFSKWVPRSIRHSFMFVELFLRFVIMGIKLKPDVIHCHDTLVLPIGVFLKIILKSKVIYDAHELESNKNGQTKFLSKATLYIEKLCWSRIDHLISVSKSILRWYESNLGVMPNTLILNSPMLTNIDTKPNKYFHNLYNIPENSLVFVYLGILGQGRGIDFILDAFCNKSISSHVVFIGYGDFTEKIKELALKESNIHFHNSVPHEDVVGLVKNADVGLCLIENVSLSDYYCLPNKLFEYAFAGLKILTSDFPDIIEVVDEYDLGRTCAINSNSIYNAICEMELHPFVPNDKDLKEISWQNQAKRLNETYARINK